jgi:hypothetical protein
MCSMRWAGPNGGARHGGGRAACTSARVVVRQVAKAAAQVVEPVVMDQVAVRSALPAWKAQPVQLLSSDRAIPSSLTPGDFVPASPLADPLGRNTPVGIVPGFTFGGHRENFVAGTCNSWPHNALPPRSAGSSRSALGQPALRWTKRWRRRWRARAPGDRTSAARSRVHRTLGGSS